jgi:hypothetical protein
MIIRKYDKGNITSYEVEYDDRSTKIFKSEKEVMSSLLQKGYLEDELVMGLVYFAEGYNELHYGYYIPPFSRGGFIFQKYNETIEERGGAA